jgi:hypothetical protein
VLGELAVVQLMFGVISQGTDVIGDPCIQSVDSDHKEKAQRVRLKYFHATLTA